MKNLKDILKESLRIGINDTPEQNIIDYADPEIKNCYLVRFMPTQHKIYVDIINIITIKLEIDKPDKKVYSISGDFSVIETNKYSNSLFTLDQSTGIIYRYVHGFSTYYDILIHPDYYKGFMEFVKSFINDEHATFYIDEVLDILGIDITNIPKEIKNVEYTTDTQYFDRIKLFLKNLKKSSKQTLNEGLRIKIDDTPEAENLEDINRLYRIDIFDGQLYLDVHQVIGLEEKNGYVTINDSNSCHSITYEGGQIPGKYEYIEYLYERFMYEEYDRKHRIRFLLFPECKTNFYNVVELIFASAHTGRLTYQLKLDDICRELNIDGIVNILNSGFPKELTVKTPTNILENIYKFKHE